MTPTKWIIVGCALAGGFVIGMILSKIINSLLGRDGRPQPLQQAAGPLSGLGFWAGVVGGLLVALGVLSPSALDQLPKDLIAFLPRLLSAAIIVIGANVMAQFATAAIAPALSRAPGPVQTRVLQAVRGLIIAMAALLAVRQLGIDTTVINLGVAAIFFGASASLTLLIGLGGRTVATEVASTRALRRLLSVGDTLTLEASAAGGSIGGEVIAIHPTSVEVVTESGDVQLVPSSALLTSTVTVRRGESDIDA